MSDQPPASDNIYSRLTGWKRVAIVVLGAVSGAVVALMFSVFSGQPTPMWELILGTLGARCWVFRPAWARSGARNQRPISLLPPNAASDPRRVFLCAGWFPLSVFG